jgi:hypothetical protein
MQPYIQMDEIFFEDYGAVVLKRDGQYFIRYDAGELVVQMKESRITEDQARKVRLSEQNA